MSYYTVNTIGTGKGDDPFRPDIPEGTPFVGQDDADGTFLILTPFELTESARIQMKLPRPALEATAKARGLTYDGVTKWKA